jgi:hypothetical protein
MTASVSSPSVANVQASDDSTSSDFLIDLPLNDGAETDPFFSDPVLAVGGIVRDGKALTLILSAIGAAPPSFLASLAARPEATSARGAKEGTSGAHGRVGGSEGPESPRSPIPDHEPQIPTAPGASGGSGSSGGHVGFTLGLTAAARNLTPRDTARPVTLIEVSPRALSLAFLLDRPG